MAETTAPRTFPWIANVGGASITLRLMTLQDRDLFLAFIKKQPPEDLFFLLMDLSTPEGMARKLRGIEAGQDTTVLAEHDGKLLGYGSLHHGETRWFRHLGEMRLLVAHNQRSRGLGKVLAQEVFSIARGLGLRKIVARMAASQTGARRLFEDLGFQIEALLADWAMDRHGKTQDLVLMSYDMSGFHD
ncbi:MAG: GNAT family N-acetyltransferase [Bryobacteraceae bacterium]|jgi:L-amino acid N-acyltransferase YncA